MPGPLVLAAIPAIASIIGGLLSRGKSPKLKQVPLTPTEQSYIEIFKRLFNQGTPGTNFVRDVAQQNVMRNPSPQFNFSPTGVSDVNRGTQFYKPPQGGGIDMTALMDRWRQLFARDQEQRGEMLTPEEKQKRDNEERLRLIRQRMNERMALRNPNYAP